MKSDQQNPFTVQSPEDIPAGDVVSLFVDVFTDFHHIPYSGHTFLNGPRGSGKSMMFRYLEPDSQQAATTKPLSDLPFFGVYIPMKNTTLTEFKRLEGRQSEAVLGEHFLVVYVAVKFFSSLLKTRIADPDRVYASRLRQFHETKFRKLLSWTGWGVPPPSIDSDKCELDQVLISFQELFSEYYGNVTSYIRKLAFETDPVPYKGPLFGYIDFLLPLIKEIRSLGFMPDGPIFLLIDDADNLNLAQTKVLNSWVSSRTSEDVSLKISTQLNYKTYLTTNGQTISAPHDFKEVNISAVYTSNRNRYVDRVEQIVARRLKMYGVEATPREFFPPYEKQEEAINEIRDELKKNWEKAGRGFRARDDVARYARPEYIRRLQGTTKSGSKYRYAGFPQLVHLSSGAVRYFLEAASLMFGETRANATSNISHIDSRIQDEVVREQAQTFFFSDFEKLEKDHEGAEGLTQIRKLRNLIWALGGTFHEILISDAAERRVFSVAFSDDPDDEVLSVFRLGVQYGYFHEGSIGNKEGTGRTRLFILSRRLAPLFLLDPTSFAGYKFVTSKVIREAMQRPQTFLRQIQSGNMDSVLEDPQMALFDDGE